MQFVNAKTQMPEQDKHKCYLFLIGIDSGSPIWAIAKWSAIKAIWRVTSLDRRQEWDPSYAAQTVLSWAELDGPPTCEGCVNVVTAGAVRADCIRCTRFPLNADKYKPLTERK